MAHLIQFRFYFVKYIFDAVQKLVGLGKIPVGYILFGSFATAVVTLLITEAAALILLLGAQVIAELERKTNELTEERLSGF